MGHSQLESMRLEFGGSQILIACPTGASHQEKGQPCQDACMVTRGYYRGIPYTFLSVADGHGSSQYDLSDIGAHFAVAAAWEAVSGLVITLATLPQPRINDPLRQIHHDVEHHLTRNIMRAWRARVDQDVKEKPPPETAVSDNRSRYGTTVAFTLLMQNWFIAATLGDGGIYQVIRGEESEIKEIASHELGSTPIGLATDSLSSTGALNRWRVHVGQISDVSTGMLLLTTDGLQDSLEDPPATIRDIFRKKETHGLDWLEEHLPKHLQRWSREGVGDDMACIVLFPATQSQPAGEETSTALTSNAPTSEATEVISDPTEPITTDQQTPVEEFLPDQYISSEVPSAGNPTPVRVAQEPLSAVEKNQSLLSFVVPLEDKNLSEAPGQALAGPHSVSSENSPQPLAPAIPEGDSALLHAQIQPDASAVAEPNSPADVDEDGNICIMPRAGRQV